MLEVDGRRFTFATGVNGTEQLIELIEPPVWAGEPDGRTYASTCGGSAMQAAGWLLEAVKLHDGRKGELKRRVESFLRSEQANARRLTGLAVAEAYRQGRDEVAANLAALI
jgi:hypothetical protein